ncbi:MAG: hypothetical protein K9J30_12950 [Bacteroidales bacterium]|nr:hypothetical protein [Bacteroidales bacterium]
MILRIAIPALFLLLTVPETFCQSRKTIENKGIIKQTVYEYFIGEGLKDPVVEMVEQYDTTGRVIETKVFNKEGKIKEWKQYRYNSEGEKTEEVTLDGKGRTEEREVWVYKDGLVIEKKYYDHKDRLYKRKEYRYEYHGED